MKILTLTSRLRNECGQAITMCAALLVLLLGVSALAIDMGNLYWSYNELLSAAQAAAKAGGGAMANPNVTSAQTVAYTYSGDPNAPYSALYNIHPNLNMTSVSATFACVPVSSYTGLSLPPCIKYSNACSTAACNAIQVVEKATVSTFIARVFGVRTLSLTATATASAAGSGTPYHVAVVIDSTASMGPPAADTDCSASVSGSFTPEQCAQLGVQTLLSVMNPGTATSPIDEVALFTFPGLCSQTLSGKNCPTASSLTDTVASSYASDDSTCPASNPPITSYNNDPAYLIVGFPNALNYINSSTGELNTTNSSLVNAVGAGTWTTTGDSNTCGITTPGGEGTFYAGSIVAAQQYLTANHTSGIQDVIIYLSDGDANASSTQLTGNVPMPSAVQAYFDSQTSGNTLIAQNSSKTGYIYTTTGECTQAVYAADWAKSLGTEIYAVSYGSESSGCTKGEVAPYTTPCATIQGISSGTGYFFSVGNSSNGNAVCSGAAQGISGMKEVFTYIGGKLTGSRLIPNSTWPSS
jgi:hypothetical protein